MNFIHGSSKRIITRREYIKEKQAMFVSLGRFIYRWRWGVLLAGLLFIVVSGVYGTSVFPSLKGGGFYAPDAESTRAAAALHTDLGRDAGSLIVLFTSPDGSAVDSPQYRQAVESTLAKVNGKPGTGSITTF